MTAPPSPTALAAAVRSAAIRDAAYTAVAVAAVAYQEGHIGLVRTLACAHSHGLTVDQLVEASGRDRALIEQLLTEAD